MIAAIAKMWVSASHARADLPARYGDRLRRNTRWGVPGVFLKQKNRLFYIVMPGRVLRQSIARLRLRCTHHPIYGYGLIMIPRDAPFLCPDIINAGFTLGTERLIRLAERLNL